MVSEGSANEGDSSEIYRRIFDAIRGIRYGSVEVIIHDSQVVQIERKEKVRFDVGANRAAGGADIGGGR